jgi:hypothetical protein
VAAAGVAVAAMDTLEGLGFEQQEEAYWLEDCVTM